MYLDPHEPKQRRGRYEKISQDEEMLAALNELLKQLELPTQRRLIDVGRLPVIYIVGAPRSGTTLLSQVLSRYLPLGYINNVIARFWLRPSVGIRLSQILLGDKVREGIIFHSTHGVTEGICGPHEFGYFWRHWLQLDSSPTHHLSSTALARVDRAGLKHALEEEILGTFQAGVIFKNVICGFHAALLRSIHPHSLFIHIVREPFETSASILASRMERFGTYEAWWSLKPSTYPFDLPKGDPAAEVVRQVLDCRRETDEELHSPGVTGMTVAYEDLCGTPRDVVEKICYRLSEMGTPISPIHTDFPTFRATPRSRLPEDLEARVRECVREEASIAH